MSSVKVNPGTLKEASQCDIVIITAGMLGVIAICHLHSE
jgi:hypothetical protein